MPSHPPTNCNHRPLALPLLASLALGLCPLASAATGHRYWTYGLQGPGLFTNYPYGGDDCGFRWKITLSRARAIADAANAKNHLPAHIAEINGMITRAVQAMQPIARRPFPPNSTQAQKRLFEDHQLGHIKRIASKLLGRAASIPLIIQGVSTDNGGQYGVVVWLAWKPAMRLTAAQRLTIQR